MAKKKKDNMGMSTVDKKVVVKNSKTKPVAKITKHTDPDKKYFLIICPYGGEFSQIAVNKDADSAVCPHCYNLIINIHTDQ